MDIKGRVALVTGASSGLGRDVARILFDRGASVALVARNEHRLQRVAKEISSDKTRVLVVRADVTNRDAIQSAVARTVEHFGQLDILINNAGLGYFGSLENMPIDAFDAVVQTNVYGLINATQAAIPHLKKTRGTVVNISSGLSKRALPYLATYAGTKSMVDALSDGLRLELRPYGINVVNYGPPETETEFHKRTLAEPGMDATMRRRRFAKSEDVADRIVQAVIQDKREVNEASFLKVMNFLAPRLLDTMFYKGMVLKLKKE